MPYIPQKDRVKYQQHLDPLKLNIDTPGELNYVISKLCHNYLIHNADRQTGYNYELLNEIHGVMVGAASEFFYRVMTPYETVKRRMNGTVSALDDKCNHSWAYAVGITDECPFCGDTK